MWLLYRAFSALLLVLAGPFALLARGRLGSGVVSGRLARTPPRPPTPPVWIHAVSVGEAMVAATLARGLPEELPLVVTTVTPTGQERARRSFAGRAEVGWFPFELQSAVERFFDAVRPRLLVLVEVDGTRREGRQENRECRDTGQRTTRQWLPSAHFPLLRHRRPPRAVQ